MSAFWIALQFLTRLPCPQNLPNDAQLVGRSALFYPLVGTVIGLLLYGAAWLSSLLDSPADYSSVFAAIILSLWAALTGALHLDGLGDSADAWLGGGTDRQRCFEIMQDPRSGTAAVVSIILLLLLKFVALDVLLTQQQFWPLLLAPIIGRASVLALLLNTPNARPDGFSAAINNYLPRTAAIGVVIVSALLLVIITPLAGSITLLAVTLTVYLLRRLMMQRLGGATGDTCGAVVEIVEASVLLSWCFLA